MTENFIYGSSDKRYWIKDVEEKEVFDTIESLYKKNVQTIGSRNPNGLKFVDDKPKSGKLGTRGIYVVDPTDSISLIPRAHGINVWPS